jgi:hypothetical protein
MGRYVGSTGLQGQFVSTTLKTQPFTRATGITTDANNNVTSLTAGDISYPSITYNGSNFITAYTEVIGGVRRSYSISYDANGNVSSITEV